MALDNVPWLVAGGAVHSAEVARTLAYVAVGGAEGVADIGDMKVSQISTPTGQVKVAAGAVAITNTYAGQTAQSYIGRNTADTLLAIAPTSGAPRSDMIVARIDDPQYGGTVPADPAAGPYIKFAVVSNVGSTADANTNLAVSYPYVPLARIDIPASTSAITNAMVKDLRRIIAPRKDRQLVVVQPGGTQTLTSASPTYAEFPAQSAQVYVPTWATRAIITANIGGLKFTAADGKGAFRAKLGADAFAVTTQSTAYDNTGNSSASFRSSMPAGGSVAVPASYRGTNQDLSLEGAIITGTGGARAAVDTGSTIILDIEFVEDPI